MDNEYLNSLYNWISSKDNTFKSRYTEDDFMKNMSEDDYAKKMYNWISSKDNTFKGRYSESDFLTKINPDKKKDQGQDMMDVFPSFPESSSSESQPVQEQPTDSELARSAAESFLYDSDTTTEEAEEYLRNLRDSGEDIWDEGNFVDQAIAVGLTSETTKPFRQAGRAAVALNELGISDYQIKSLAYAQQFSDFATSFIAGEEDLAKIKAQQSTNEHRLYDFSNVNGSNQTYTLNRALLEAKEMGSSEYQKILEQLPDDEELSQRLKDADKYREKYTKQKEIDPESVVFDEKPKTDQQVRDEYIQELFIKASGSKIKDRIESLLPEDVKNDDRFLQMLSDRIYDEAGVPTNLDGDNTYNDVPLVEYLGKLLDSSTYSLASSLDYGLAATAGWISDDPDAYKKNKEKRAEINSNLEKISSLNTQFVAGISESIAMGDIGNAVQQTIGGLVQTLPIMAVTLATAPIGGTAGVVAGALLSGTLGGIQTYVGIRDMQVVDPNDPSKMIDAYTESTALGQAFISGLGEGAFSLIGGKIFKNASKAASMGQMIGVSRGSMRSFAKGVAKEYGLAMAEEGFTEFATELTNYIAESQLKEGAEFDFNEAIHAGVDAFMVGAAAGVGFKVPGDLISGNLNYNSYAAAALFDPANIEVYSRIDSEIETIKSALENESDPKKKRMYESQISALTVKKAEIRQSRSAFFDAMYARNPELMEGVLNRDGEIHAYLSSARQAKADGNLELEKKYKDRAKELAENKMSIIDRFSAELQESPLTPDEKLKIYEKKMDDSINDVKNRALDIEESLYALYAEAESGRGEISPGYQNRLEQLQSQLDDANSELEALESVRLDIIPARKRINELSAKQKDGKLTRKEKAELVTLSNTVEATQGAMGKIYGVDFANDPTALDPNDYMFDLASQSELDELLSLSTSTNMDSAIEAIANNARTLPKEKSAAQGVLDTVRDLVEDDLEESLAGEESTSGVSTEVNLDQEGGGKRVATIQDISETQDAKSYSEAMALAVQRMKEEGKKEYIQVTPLSENDLNKILDDGGRLFMGSDGMSGGYVMPNGYMGGLFKNPDSKLKGISKPMQQARKAAGGKFFDAFATELEGMYISNGYKPVARLDFNEEFAPEGWDDPDSPLKDKPDVVFFTEGSGEPGGGVRIDEYDDAYNYSLDLANKTPTQESVDTKEESTDTTTQEVEDPKKGSVDINNLNDVRALINESVQNGDAVAYNTNEDGSIGIAPTGLLSGKVLADLNKSVAGLSRTLGRKLRVVVTQSSNMGDNFTEPVRGFFDSSTGTIFIDPNQFTDSDSLSNLVFEEIAHGVFDDAVVKMDVNSRRSLVSDFIDSLGKESDAIIAALDEKIRGYSEARNVPLKSEEKSGREFILDNISIDLFAKETVAEIIGTVDVDSLSSNAFEKIRDYINGILSKVLPAKVMSRVKIKTKSDMKRFADAIVKIKSGERAVIDRRTDVDDVSYSLGDKKEGVNASESELRKIFPDRDFVSPFDLPDGPITVTYDQSFYKRGKDIGSEQVTMNFNNKEHFINWWKKTTFKDSRYGENRTGLYFKDRLKNMKAKKLEFSNHRVEINGKTVFVDTDVLVNKYKPFTKEKKKPFVTPFYKKRGKVSTAYNNISADLQAAYNDNIITKDLYEGTLKKLKDIAIAGISFEMNIEKSGGDANAYFGEYKWDAKGKYDGIADRLEKARVSVNNSLSEASKKQGGYFKYSEGGKFYSDKSRGIDDISYNLFIPEGKLSKVNKKSKRSEIEARLKEVGLPVMECNFSLNRASVREICLDFIRSKFPDATPDQRLAYATLLELRALNKAFSDPNNIYVMANVLDFQKRSLEATEILMEDVFEELGMRPTNNMLPLFRVISAITSNGTDRVSNFISAMDVFKTVLVTMEQDGVKIPDSTIWSVKNGKGVYKTLRGDRRKTMANHLSKLNKDIENATFNNRFNGAALAAKMQGKAKKSRKGEKGWTYGMERFGGTSVGKLGSHFTVMMGGEAVVLDKNFLNFIKKYTGDVIEFDDKSYFFNRAEKRLRYVLKEEGVDVDKLDKFEIFNKAVEVKKDPSTSKDGKRAIRSATSKMLLNETDLSFNDGYSLVSKAKSFIDGLGENDPYVQEMLNSVDPSQRDMFYKTNLDGSKEFSFPMHLFQAIAYAGEQAHRKVNQNSSLKGYTDDFVVAEAISSADGQATIDELIEEERNNMEDVEMSAAIYHYDSSTVTTADVLNTEQLSVDAVEINVTDAKDVKFFEGVDFEPNTNNLEKARSFEEVSSNDLIGINGKESSASNIPETGVEVFFNPLVSDYPTTKNLEEVKSASRLVVIDGRMFIDGNVSTSVLAMGSPDQTDGKSFAGMTESVKEKIMSYAVNILGMNPDNVDVDLIYEATSKDVLMKVDANDSFASNVKSNNDSISYGLRIRETAKKGAKKVRQARDKILSNPENYISPQRLKSIKNRLSQMSDAELVSEIESSKLALLMNSEKTIAPLAAGELINREVARAEITGNYDAVADLYEEAAKMGTTAGRILRQLRELSSTTPKGMAAQIKAAAKRSGNYLTPEQETKLEDACGKLLDATRKHKDLSGRARSGEDVEADLKKAYEELMVAKKNMGELTNRYINKGFGDIFTQLIQGNLLTPESHQTNLVSNIMRMFDLSFVNAIALPIDNLFKRITEGKTATTRTYSFLAQIEGLKAMGSGFIEALKTVKTGQDPDTRSEWRMSAGLMPFRSLMDAMTGKDLPLNDKGKVSVKNRARLFVQGTLGISPEINFRILGLFDTPFRKYVEAVELHHIGTQRGLEGEALKDFIKYPDLKSLEKVESEGRKLTFQEDTSSSEAAMSMVKGVEKFIGFGLRKAFGEKAINPDQAAKVFVRVFTPYVKTPANILSETLTYISPYYATLRIASDLRKGDSRAAAQNLGKAMIGSIAAETAVLLIREGLISGSTGYEDKEDEALTNIMYDHFKPDSINITGLTRFLSGGDPTHRPTDWTMNYKKLGIMGQVIATVVNSADPEELKARDYSNGKFLHHAIRDSFGMNPMSGVSEALDQSFLQGMESFLQVLTSLKAGSSSAERSVEKFLSSIMRSASSSVLPNSLSALNRSQREWMPDMRVSRDMPLEDRLYTHFKYIIKDRLFSTSDLPIRVNWKGEDIPQTPDERNGVFYHLFDITNASQGASDAVTNEIWRLYNTTGHASLIAGTPKYANYYGGRIDVPNLIKSKEKRALRMLDREYTFLEDEDFVAAKMFFDVETLARVMRVSGRDRFKAAEELISSDSYQSMGDDERLKLLNKLSENYNSAVELDRGRFRPHTIELLNIFQDIYENEWGVDEE